MSYTHLVDSLLPRSGDKKQLRVGVGTREGSKCTLCRMLGPDIPEAITCKQQTELGVSGEDDVAKAAASSLAESS
eukprot:346064-Amorphochlora_amoeboformis.AAC.1